MFNLYGDGLYSNSRYHINSVAAELLESTYQNGNEDQKIESDTQWIHYSICIQYTNSVINPLEIAIRQYQYVGPYCRVVMFIIILQIINLTLSASFLGTRVFTFSSRTLRFRELQE